MTLGNYPRSRELAVTRGLGTPRLNTSRRCQFGTTSVVDCIWEKGSGTICPLRRRGVSFGALTHGWALILSVETDIELVMYVLDYSQCYGLLLFRRETAGEGSLTASAVPVVLILTETLDPQA